MAWLSAAPEPASSAEPKTNRPAPVPRRQSTSIPEHWKKMPPIVGSDFCLACLHRVGVVVRGMSGVEPVPWSEIRAFNECSGYELNSWQMETIRELSEAYVAAYTAAQDPNCAPPYMAVIDKREHARIMRQRLRG